MDYVYARRNYNYSDILHKTTLDRKGKWLMTDSSSRKKVNAMKNAGSSKKSGGFANQKRKRLSLTQFPVVDEA